MKKFLNESTNTVLKEMFEDKCILGAHITNDIYEAKYEYDVNVFIFSDFNKITLETSDYNLERQ